MRKLITRCLRILHIYRICAKFELNEWCTMLPGYRGFYWIRSFFKKSRKLDPEGSQGERLCQALEQLGPLFVKFGQLLSTRRDWVSEEMAKALTKLQDKVPPFPGEQARHLIENYLKTPIHELFSEFDLSPLGSASIAQVHAARLHTGEAVVVKLLRPGIRKQITRDIDLLYGIAKLSAYTKRLKQLSLFHLVEELERFLLEELDLLQEAANASQLRRNAQSLPFLRIPKIYWAYTNSHVLVMERMEGLPIGDHQQLSAHSINFKKLADRTIEIFFTQLFHDSFFHADMHPGNIFISPINPLNPDYILVDFGIVGSLNSLDQRYLAENLIAFFKRDYRQVARLHLESGWIPADISVDKFAAAIRKICEPILDRPLKEISIAHLLTSLFQTARQFKMRLQPQLVLLQKTLFNIEALSRQLDPNIDLWKTAQPFLDQWLKKQIGPRALLRKLHHALSEWSEVLPKLPRLLHHSLLINTQQNTKQVKRALRLRRIIAPTIRLSLILSAGWISCFLMLSYPIF